MKNPLMRNKSAKEKAYTARMNAYDAANAGSSHMEYNSPSGWGTSYDMLDPGTKVWDTQPNANPDPRRGLTEEEFQDYNNEVNKSFKKASRNGKLAFSAAVGGMGLAGAASAGLIGAGSVAAPGAGGIGGTALGLGEVAAGAAAGGAGDAAAGLGWMGGADSVGLGTMGDALAGGTGLTGLPGAANLLGTPNVSDTPGATPGATTGPGGLPTIPGAPSDAGSWLKDVGGWLGPLLGTVAGVGGSIAAGNAQSDAAQKALDLQERMFNKQNELQEPFRQAGIAGQNRLMEFMGLGGDKASAGYGKYTKDFGTSDFQQDPGYQFRLTEGLKAMDRTAAARGGLMSGSALKAGQRYGQDAASQEYQNAFNRYQVNRSNQLNPLQSLSNQGQTATNVMTGNAGQYGQNAADAYAGQGIARSGAYTGAANAFTGGINNYLNYQQGQDWLNKVAKPGG